MRLGFAVEIHGYEDVRLARLAAHVGDARPIDERVRDRRPRLRAGSADLEAADPEVARELDIGVAIADHGGALAIERRGVDEVADEPDRGFAAVAALLCRCGQTKLPANSMPCDANSVFRNASTRSNGSRGWLGVPSPPWFVTIARS